MNKFFYIFIVVFLLKESFLSNPCSKIEIKPFMSNEIYIERNTTKCSYFSFDNPSEGNIILKLAKSNSFTSIIYIYESEDKISYNSKEELMENYLEKFHIGEEFFKEKKLENMKMGTYYFVIFENDFYFKDELIIYNDKFDQNNFYELNTIETNQKNEFDFKYEYTNNNPILIHFKFSSSDIKYLNYQFVNCNTNGKVSFYIYENNLETGEQIEKVEDQKENNNYLSLKSDTDYYVKIITDGEINLIFDFLDNKVMKITPDDIFQKELITLNDYYFFIEKELVFENDEYFNEFTIKLDSTNLEYLPFEVIINTCEKNSEDELIKCIDAVDLIPKTIIKRDIDIPYIYHIYYSFNGLNNLVIKIMNKKSLEKKQRLIIEASGGNDLVDSKHDKVFTDNKGYLYPVYLNVSIDLINDEFNKNKSRILFVYTNTTSAIKVFFNDDTFKKESLEINSDEYVTIDNYVYGFDFNKDEVKQLFGNRKYFTIMIYCPWESSPISFQLTFINDNIHNFNYVLDNKRPLQTPIKVSLNAPNEKYYFIGQYNTYDTDILFNEIVYGKVIAKYKYFNGNEKLSRIIFNDTADGYNFNGWTPIHTRIDIIEIISLSPTLLYMHFIEDNAIKINDIILEEGSQNYIFLNNTNFYNIALSNTLKRKKNINIEVSIVSKIKYQSIGVIINNDTFTLNLNENNLFRYNTKEKTLENFGIQGMGKPTTVRIKIGAGLDNKNIAYYQEYKKSTENKNEISQKIDIDITNKNNKKVKLCYTMNFVGEELIYDPTNENCFELNKNEKTTLTMYNPWDKYLKNENNLFTDTDSYYIMIYIEDSSLKDNLEFKSNEEIIKFNTEYEESKYISISNKETNVIKSSLKEEQNILIQFSPVDNLNKNNNENIEDKYFIKSKFGDIILEGKIYSKNNRTFVAYNDLLIDSYLEFDIQSDNKYEVKYNYFSNKNNLYEEIINTNYSIELINDGDSEYVKFRPLIKGKNIDYYLYISLKIDDDLSKVSNLKSLENDKKNTYILHLNINTDLEFSKIDITSEISKEIKSKEFLLNILAEEKESYNICMSYDVIKVKENSQKKEEKEKGGSSAGKVFLALFIIILIGACAYGAFYFIKKKRNKDDALLDDINDVNLSMEDQTERGLNTEEGIIK